MEGPEVATKETFSQSARPLAPIGNTASDVFLEGHPLLLHSTPVSLTSSNSFQSYPTLILPPLMVHY